jgi:hypothetical protein
MRIDMTEHLVPLAAVVAVVGLVQAALLWRLLRLGRDLRTYDERFGHLSDAVCLLTETTEASFRAVALEVERLAAAGGARATNRTSTRRVAAAARRGRSIQEIAATEKVSEGEVRLRLHLAEDVPAERVHHEPSRLGGVCDEFVASA